MLDGTLVPYDLPIEELDKMMSSPIMKEFSLACEALSQKNNPEAYQIMKSYINDKDKYRRLYILKTIFRHSEAVELVDYLENAIASDDYLFVDNGLTVISNYKIKVSDTLLLSAVSKRLPKLYMEVRALRMLDISEEHYTKIIELFKRAKQCAQKEFIGEILIEQNLPAKSKELFDLFSCDEFAKIRLFAIELANKFGYNLSKFLLDKDGHVRKLAMKSLGE